MTPTLKTLALLLFASCASAQPRSWVDDCIDSIGTRLELYHPVRAIDFVQYSEECYNDSTDDGVVFWRYPTEEEKAADSTLRGWQTMVVRDQYSHWTHRAPTFKGFVEYLKSQAAEMRRLKERVREKAE